MKKLLLMLFMVPVFTHAQSVLGPDIEYDAYCIVTYNIESKGVIAFDDDNKYLCDEEGKEIKFGSLASLLTYMSKMGWSFVWQDEVKVLATRCPRVLLKKRIKDDSEITQHLHLKDLIKKKKE